jgi:S1-C subfamily serine protease
VSRKAGLSAELQALSPDLAEALGLKGQHGALVTLVYPSHASEQAGLQQGDILVSLEGDPVRCSRPEDIDDLHAQIRRYRIGSTVECEILRNGQRQPLSLKLHEDPRTAEDRQRYRDETFDLTLEKLTELDRIHGDLPPSLQAVRIAQVETGGWAQLAGLRGGDLVLTINHQSTPDVATAESFLRHAAETHARHVTLFVRRGVRTLFAEIEPSWP